MDKVIDIVRLMKDPRTQTTKEVKTRSGGRSARQKKRTSAPIHYLPTLERNISVFEMASKEAIEMIHDNSCKILEEIGIEFRDDEAAEMWKEAGADVDGYRVRIDRKLLMEKISTIPSEITLNARNPERTVSLGGKKSIFVPMYGAPYVRGLDGERRYGTLEDLNNFHKLAQMAPQLHSASSIICEPMDIPVPHRHLHIMNSIFNHSDKTFMGIVTSKERAQDALQMAKIVFGEDYVKDNSVMTSVANANSPLVWDATMLDAVKVYASHNQPILLSPFALCGASTPASTIGAVAQVNAEALAGLAFTQLVRAGSPQVYGQFMVAVDMRTGAPMGGTVEATHMTYLIGQLARFYGVPWRTSASHVGSKIADAQAGYEGSLLMHAALLAGANYIWHAAGWLEAGLVASVSKFVLDCEQLEGWYRYAKGIDFDDLQPSMQAIAEIGPAGHYLGTQHTFEKFQSAFHMPDMMDFNSFEQWEAEGERDANQRAIEKAEKMLKEYEAPGLDIAIKEELKSFIAKREEEIPAEIS